MKRAAAYARYSTDKQYDTSIEKQLEDIREYCKKKDYEIVKEYVDKAESTSKEDRPAFRQMLQDGRQNLFDVVVVHKLNRFARDRYLSVVTAHELKKYNVEVDSVLEPIGSDPVGQLLWGILDAVNEFERLNLIQEVKLKSRPLAAKGYWLGGKPPYGFQIVKVRDESNKEHSKLEVNKEEAEVIKKMFELFIQGYSFSKIADTLNQMGLRNRVGNPWKFSAISEIIKNSRYAGQHFWGRGTKTNHRIFKQDAVVVNGPAVIDKETWQKAQERLQKYVRRRPLRYPYMLRGLVFCQCGAPMYGAFSTIPVYRCKLHSKSPGHVSISAKRLETFVKTKLQRMLNENIDFELLTRSLNEMLKENDPGDLEELLKQQQEYMQMIENLTEALAKIPASAQQVVINKIEEYSKMLETINEKIKHAQTKRTEFTVEEIRELYEALKNSLESDFELVAHKLTKKVTVYKGGYIEVETQFDGL
ncbi:MAG: hypothetical protein DRP33_02640 [Thermotogae bacterium]|nr:MAG: hypothetical protein DRP33_02640 [Thermotogota bacterium]